MQRSSKLKPGSPYRSKLPAVEAKQKGGHAHVAQMNRNEITLPEIQAPSGPSGPFGPAEGPISPERNQNSDQKVCLALVSVPNRLARAMLAY